MDGCLSTVNDPRAGPCCSGGLHSPHHANTSHVLRSRRPRAGGSIRLEHRDRGLLLLRRSRSARQFTRAQHTRTPPFPCAERGFGAVKPRNTALFSRSMRAEGGTPRAGGKAPPMHRCIRAVTSTRAVPALFVGAFLLRRTWVWCGKTREYRTILTFYAPGRWDPWSPVVMPPYPGRTWV